jgi:YgiT-type zinc finger domain-containing protein
MKTCFQCKGVIEERSTTLEQRWKGKLFVIEDIPAEICTQCGEKYLSAEVLEKIDTLLEAGAPVERVISIPVMKYKVA